MSFGYQVLGFGSGGGAAPLDVDYLVVAGGGAAVYGGGGAGGYRTSFPGGTKLTLKGGTAVPITVGDGALASAPTDISADGSPSTFAAATPAPLVSAGGGGSSPLQQAGTPGGSGGGSNAVTAPAVGTPGIGNVPPTTPPQGNDGGVGLGYAGQACSENGGGGGGAGGNGGNGMGPYGSGGVGGVGAGVPTDFVSPSYGTPGPSPTIRYFAGGGSGRTIGTGAQAIGGYGGGGNGERYGRGPGCGSPVGEIAATAGTVNTGGGNGAGEPPYKAGGPGVVLVNAPADADFTIGPPTNVEITNPDGTKTAVFTVSGTIQNG